jgi:hypothetical protein
MRFATTISLFLRHIYKCATTSPLTGDSIMTKNYQLFLVAFLCLSISEAMAQKLPNVQETSLLAPTDVKVDGKAGEWNSQFQAYNKAVELFYTITNDNEKLYVAIQTADLDIANKIICAGMTLTINGSGRMKDKDGMAITFPFLNKFDFPELIPPVNYTLEPTAMNGQFIQRAKHIRVKGLTGITDSLISIYNPEGIKVAALFDQSKVFNYELSVPLKQLGVTVNESRPLVYNIKLNGNLIDPGKSLAINYNEAFFHTRNALRRDLTSFGVVDDKVYFDGAHAARIESVISPTDFWGEYTLAK